MVRALPLGPLLLCLLGSGVVLVGIYMNALSAKPIVDDKIDLGNNANRAQNVQAITYHDPIKASGLVAAIQTKSPFVKDRSAFSRLSVSQEPQVRDMVFEPNFVGTLGRGSDMKAMIVWAPNDPAQTLTLGQQTPIGVLVSITTTTAVFDDNGELRTLELF